MFIKKIINKIINYNKFSIYRNVLTLYPPKNIFPKKNYKGYMLLSYLTLPFYKKDDDPIFKTHSNNWECVQIANTFLELGYVVDVIMFNNLNYIPKKKYKVFIDLGYNIERMYSLLNKDCVKIFHITGSHWLDNNMAEYQRLAELRKRRNMILLPRALSKSEYGIEYADMATALGNKYTIDTYKYQGKKIYRIPISSNIEYDFPENKDVENVKKRYLWLGSVGSVHRGLDLVLEAFYNLPDYELIICGPIKEESDFEKIYYKELYETKNIKTIGWIDVTSSQFKKITDNCVGIIYPSCAEGGGGSVVTCMHAGLIPIVSYESSVDVEDFGFILKENTIDEIVKTIKLVSSLGINDLKERSFRTWEFARKNHTREKFKLEYRKFVKEILKL